MCDEGVCVGDFESDWHAQRMTNFRSQNASNYPVEGTWRSEGSGPEETEREGGKRDPQQGLSLIHI